MKRRSKRKGRRTRRNPSRRSRRSPAGAIKGVLGGFNVGALTDAGVLFAGLTANLFATNLIARQSFTPSFAQAGIGKAALGIASASLLGFGARKVLPRQAGLIFQGALLASVAELLTPLVDRVRGMAGLNDYATESQVAAARPIDSSMSGLAGLDYIGDYATTTQVGDARSIDSSLAGMADF